MAEAEAKTGEDECIICDRIWAGLAILAAAAVGLIAFDMFTGYQVSRWIGQKFPRLQALTEAEGGDDDSADA